MLEYLKREGKLLQYMRQDAPPWCGGDPDVDRAEPVHHPGPAPPLLPPQIPRPSQVLSSLQSPVVRTAPAAQVHAPLPAGGGGLPRPGRGRRPGPGTRHCAPHEPRLTGLQGLRCVTRCTTDAGCQNRRKLCLCDGLCGMSCIRPEKECPELPDPPSGQVAHHISCALSGKVSRKRLEKKRINVYCDICLRFT